MVNLMDPSSSSALLPLPDQDTPALVATVAGLLLEKGWLLATAESCTGG